MLLRAACEVHERDPRKMPIENPDELTTFVGHLKRIQGLGRIYKRAGRGGGGEKETYTSMLLALLEDQFVL